MRIDNSLGLLEQLESGEVLCFRVSLSACFNKGKAEMSFYFGSYIQSLYASFYAKNTLDWISKELLALLLINSVILIRYIPLISEYHIK